MKKYLTILLFVVSILSCTDTNSENVRQAKQELSSSASLVFSISDMYLSNSGWGSNGAVFCDAQNRCISDHYNSTDAGTGIIQFSGLSSCPHLISATLNFSTTEWDSVIPKAEVHRLLKPITLPTCPFGGAASSTTIGWRYSTSGVSWTELGAHGIGTDVSSESVSLSVGSGSNVTHSEDVTNIVDPCIGSGICNLAVFSVPDVGQTSPSHHFWLLTGTPTLVFTCDENVAGSGGSTTTTSTTGSGGSCN
jgi:hypothetical protein